MNSELRIVDAPYFSSTWVGIAMLSRRAWCARALLALVTAMALLAGLTLVTLLALLAGLPLRTLLSRGPLLRSWACVATANKYG